MATHVSGRGRTQVAAPRAGTTEAEVRPYPGYKTLWMWLLLGWVASGADRTITGPVVTYMIQAKTPIIAGAANPYTYRGGTVPGHGRVPQLDTIAAAGPTQGALLLFKIQTVSLDNRPLTFHVVDPTDAAQTASAELDV